MSAAERQLTPPESSGFTCLELTAAETAPLDGLLTDAALGLAGGIACLDAWCKLEGADMPELYWSAMRMLRQAAFAVERAERTSLRVDAGALKGCAA